MIELNKAAHVDQQINTKDTFMRYALFALIVAAASSLSGATKADEYRWCAVYGTEHGGINCGYSTLAHCRAAISGNGGTCHYDPIFDGKPDRRPRLH